MAGKVSAPGFQGSERTGAEVTFYPQGGDPVVVSQEAFGTTGKYRYDDLPSIVSVTTQEQMGAPGATWSLSLKAGKRHHHRELFDDLVDDDWVDISFYRHGRKWHVVRGQVDEIRRSTQVSTGQATSTTWSITGRSFASIWEKTAIWFNQYTNESVYGAMSQLVSDGAESIQGTPADAIRGFLRAMLEVLADVGRATWAMPPGMRNTSDYFLQSMRINTDGYTNDPPLVRIDPNWLLTQGTLWSLAKEWSDPLFHELFTGQYRRDKDRPDMEVEPGEEVRIDDSMMTVIFRERPFPTLEKGRSSPWWKLPLWIIPRQMIIPSEIGRGGAERYNAFFVSPQITQEVAGSGSFDINQALWHRDDIQRHGLRRFDVVTRYTSPEADLVGMSERQRTKIKDWYALNPHFLNGTISLAIGRPDIRLGVRARIPGTQGPETDETYYVESINHQWSLPVGLRTSLGVTRGWIGTDNSLMDALYKVAGDYSLSGRSQPIEYLGVTIP